MNDLTRPIIGIENRTAQEVFDLMCDRLRAASITPPAPERSKEEVGVKIKPLEWDAPYGHGASPYYWVICAKTQTKGYRIDWEGYGLNHTDHPGPFKLMDVGNFPTVAEAKAAAQADYEQRIRSALSPTVSQPVTGEEVDVYVLEGEWGEYEQRTQQVYGVFTTLVEALSAARRLKDVSEAGWKEYRAVEARYIAIAAEEGFPRSEKYILDQTEEEMAEQGKHWDKLHEIEQRLGPKPSYVVNPDHWWISKARLNSIIVSDEVVDCSRYHHAGLG